MVDYIINTYVKKDIYLLRYKEGGKIGVLTGVIKENKEKRYIVLFIT